MEKAEIIDQMNHFSERMDDFANHLQTAMNPMCEVENGKVKTMLQADAIGEVWNRTYKMEHKVDTLYERTAILEDLAEIKKSYLSLKQRLMKYIFKPIFKFLVFLSIGFLVIYYAYELISGKMTIIEVAKHFINLFI